MERTNEIECPFTWNIDTTLLLNDSIIEKLVEIDIYDQPVIYIINQIILACGYSLKKDYCTSNQVLGNLEYHVNFMEFVLMPIHEGISWSTITHIIQATRYCIDISIGKKIYPPTPLTLDLNNDVATLNACKSIAWHCFSYISDQAFWNSENYANKAALILPNSPLFLFLVGRNLLHPIYFTSLIDWPLLEEQDFLKRSFELTESSFIGIHLELVLREIGELETAHKIRENLYRSNTSSAWVMLHLALAFINTEDFEHAKKIINSVEVIKPRHVMLQHCKNTLLMKEQETKRAAETAIILSNTSLITLEETFNSMML